VSVGSSPSPHNPDRVAQNIAAAQLTLTAQRHDRRYPMEAAATVSSW
jgi:hypothetical protein